MQSLSPMVTFSGGSRNRRRIKKKLRRIAVQVRTRKPLKIRWKKKSKVLRIKELMSRLQLMTTS